MTTTEVPRRDGRTIIIPATAEGPGGVIGDGTQRITPGDPRWDAWDAWLQEQGR